MERSCACEISVARVGVDFGIDAVGLCDCVLNGKLSGGMVKVAILRVVVARIADAQSGGHSFCREGARDVAVVQHIVRRAAH